MASSICLKAIAFSARPGIGRVREIEPSATTKLVVLQLVGLALARLQGDRAAGVVDAGDACGDHVSVAERLAQRDDDVAWLERSSRCLGEEWLVGHRRARVDHGDAGLAATDGLLESECGVHADVSATQDHDVSLVQVGSCTSPACSSRVLRSCSSRPLRGSTLCNLDRS